MLTDKHTKLLYDYQRPDKVFPNTNNHGGACSVARDRRFDNSKGQMTIVSNYGGGKTSMQHRSLKTKGLEIFTRHQESITILTKATRHPGFSSIASYILFRKSFGAEGNIVEDNSLFKRRRTKSNPILCYGCPPARGYVPLSLVRTDVGWIERYKVYIPYTNNIGIELSGDDLNVLTGAPNTVCSGTFLMVGADLNLLGKETTNIVLYPKTEMVRFLHNLGKPSRHGTSKIYRFVPLQDFTVDFDIDWSQSVTDIDHQLYKKYVLTPDKIAFIKEKVRLMV